MNFFYVYILLSLKDGSLYIGYSTDLIKRVKQHNNGECLATEPYIPYKLIFYEAFLNRIDAKNREQYLKGGYGRKTIKALLNRYLKIPQIRFRESIYQKTWSDRIEL